MSVANLLICNTHLRSLRTFLAVLRTRSYTQLNSPPASSGVHTASARSTAAKTAADARKFILYGHYVSEKRSVAKQQSKTPLLYNARLNTYACADSATLRSQNRLSLSTEQVCWHLFRRILLLYFTASRVVKWVVACIQGHTFHPHLSSCPPTS